MNTKKKSSNLVGIFISPFSTFSYAMLQPIKDSTDMQHTTYSEIKKHIYDVRIVCFTQSNMHVELRQFIGDLAPSPSTLRVGQLEGASWMVCQGNHQRRLFA